MFKAKRWRRCACGQRKPQILGHEKNTIITTNCLNMKDIIVIGMFHLLEFLVIPIILSVTVLGLQWRKGCSNVSSGTVHAVLWGSIAYSQVVAPYVKRKLRKNKRLVRMRERGSILESLLLLPIILLYFIVNFLIRAVLYLLFLVIPNAIGIILMSMQIETIRTACAKGLA